MDKTSGAKACTIQALKALKAADNLSATARQLIQEHPEMSSILRAIDACLAAVEQGEPLDSSADAIIQQIEEASAQIARQASALPSVGDQILTHSHSGTVEAALVAAHKEKQIEVIVTESRPLLEGVTLAKNLAAKQIHTTLVVDAAAISMIPYCQAVWVGADTIGKEFFANKVGTYGIALAAKTLGIPVYVLCDTWKFLPRTREYTSTAHHAGTEVLATPVEHLRVHNPYFEQIPLKFAGGIITENGLIKEISLPPLKSL